MGSIYVNLVPRAFARFRGSGTGSKGPGKHWSRVSKNIGHFVIILFSIRGERSRLILSNMAAGRRDVFEFYYFTINKTFLVRFKVGIY